jgi:dTDP-4-dehydrorhamnose reductase
LAAERDTLRVVDDQRGRPTSAEHLATASLRLVERGSAGIFHLTDGGECTWYDLAREIVAQVGSDCQVEPCGSDEFPRPAQRPAYSVLDLSKAEMLLGPMPDWRDNLRKVAQSLEA